MHGLLVSTSTKQRANLNSDNASWVEAKLSQCSIIVSDRPPIHTQVLVKGCNGEKVHHLTTVHPVLQRTDITINSFFVE